jgi:hypothetical protein
MSEDSLPRHEDLPLHAEITVRERLDTLLNSPHLTHGHAVRGMEELYRENQATFPHLVIAKVMVSREPSGPLDYEYRSYVGPFANRREAKEWAEQRYSGNDQVTWEAAKILTPEMDAQESERLRQLLEEG